MSAQLLNYHNHLYTISELKVEPRVARGCADGTMVYKPALPPGPKPGGSLPIGFNPPQPLGATEGALLG